MVPFVQESVFLHHPGIRCLLAPASRIDLFGLDGSEDKTGPARHLRAAAGGRPPRSSRSAPNRDDIIAALMQRIGIVQRRQREAGSWVIDEDPLGRGRRLAGLAGVPPGGHHGTGRIRFLVTPPGARRPPGRRSARSPSTSTGSCRGWPNERLLRPRDMVDSELGVGLVYPLDDRFQRLDLWLADQAGSLPAEDQLSLLRQVAEAVAYAHGNRVVHRGLTPHAVSVRSLPDGGGLRVLVGDWQSAGAAAGTGADRPVRQRGHRPDGRRGRSSGGNRTAKRGRASVRPGRGGRGPAAGRSVPGTGRRLEPRRGPGPDGRVRARRAGLLRAGRRPAAADRATLRERLNRDGGLDLAADLPQVTPALRALVLDATRPAVTERLPDVRAFLERLARSAEAAAEPGEDVIDPLEAAPGAVIDGRFRLQRRLGTGSTAMGLLVNDLAIAESGPDVGPGAEGRVDDARRAAGSPTRPKVLAGLTAPAPGPARSRARSTSAAGTALVLESAGDETLGEVLRDRERLSLDLLERWGTDLLEALVALDRAGVDHRDIKPANLGVREGKREDRAKHLVLFDFSLSQRGSDRRHGGHAALPGPVP